MPRYQIDEMDGDAFAASHVATGHTALHALQKITGRPISPHALQPHWFKVVDESKGVAFEYSYADHPADNDQGHRPMENAGP